MFAIGQITDRKSATGHKMVDLFVNGETKSFCLDPDSRFPLDRPSYGLFEFCPEDQFCHWINEENIIQIVTNNP